MKMLKETLLTKSDLLEFAFKEKETLQKKMETPKEEKEEAKFTCCFEYEGAYGNNNETILVNGLDNVQDQYNLITEKQ
ncbi:unnamed protein product [Arabis nemorensis]|uniref:Uncharacterized protein n=1 Tax=Arabis nemorensis TaxID=586526 RepID=A0A565B3E6_9BRAS|nr:unnamed protein product [Arabis nemorensis]